MRQTKQEGRVKKILSAKSYAVTYMKVKDTVYSLAGDESAGSDTVSYLLL